MNRSPDEISQWQKKLSDAFRGPQGFVGEQIFQLQEAEEQTRRIGVANSRGYVTAGDAFFDFAIQTLQVLSKPVHVYHIIRLPLLVSSISRIRASYNLYWMGYYFDASALLRGVFENAIHLCADAHGWAEISNWFDANGVDFSASPRKISKEMNRRIQRINRLVESIVFREASGLSQADQDELALLVNLMHSHVHRTEMHLVHLISSVRETKQPASMRPVWNDHLSSHYSNISLAIAWMFVRLISFAVPVARRSSQWIKARDTLDDSLRFWFEGWDKPLGATIVRLVDAKFSFVGEWGEPPPNSM